MKISLLQKRAVSILAALAAMFCFAAPAYAGNSSDSSFNGSVSAWNTFDTDNRQKQDATSGYIKLNGITSGRGIRAWMLGFANEDVNSQTVYLGQGQWSYVSNYTYEIYGKKQVHMRIQAQQSYSSVTAFGGVWSPDSV